MANDLIPSGSNPFLRAAEQLKRTGRMDRPALTEKTEKPTPRSQRAKLNFIPDGDLLSAMIDRALDALSRGARWARGSILNLLV